MKNVTYPTGPECSFVVWRIQERANSAECASTAVNLGGEKVLRLPVRVGGCRLADRGVYIRAVQIIGCGCELLYFENTISSSAISHEEVEGIVRMIEIVT